MVKIEAFKINTWNAYTYIHGYTFLCRDSLCSLKCIEFISFLEAIMIYNFNWNNSITIHLSQQYNIVSLKTIIYKSTHITKLNLNTCNNLISVQYNIRDDFFCTVYYLLILIFHKFHWYFETFKILKTKSKALWNQKHFNLDS